MHIPFQQPLSASEHLYLAAARLNPPCCIQILVEGRGEGEPQRLQQALL